MRALAVLACCAGLVLPVAGIYCKVGYGQRIKQNSREINFWVKTMWTRNCRGATFCFEARPALHSADAMQALVGGDWNDDYWGEAGGFVYGCQGDFGLEDKPSKGEILELGRNDSVHDAGVFVLDPFKGSGKTWPFKILEVCEENFCGTPTRHKKNAGFRSRGGATASLAALAIAATVALWASI